MPKNTPVNPVIYSEVRSEVLRGETALTINQAKDLLGWETEDDYIARMANSNPKSKKKTDFGDKFLLTDIEGNKVRCHKNYNNRPFDEDHAKRLAQDKLNGHWRLNGEAVIIGKTGRVLSAQHRLIGFVLAEQIRTHESQAYHWQEKWPDPLTLETVIVFGVEEDDETVRTLDNVKPRTLADVLFCNEKAFGTQSQSARNKLCRMLQYAVRLLWDRTKEKSNPYAPHMTHSEALEFIDRHTHIQQAVKHIGSLDQKGASVAKYLAPGTSAGLAYLMGCSATDIDSGYLETRNERHLDWSLWDKALAFWQQLANDNGAADDELKALRTARRPGSDPNQATSFYFVSGQGSGSRDEKLALLAKAWAVFAEGESPTEKDLRLRYTTDDSGDNVLTDPAHFGGIDLVGFDSRRELSKELAAGSSDDEESESDGDPNEEEIKEAAARERKRHLSEKVRKGEELKAKMQAAAAKRKATRVASAGQKKQPSTPPSEDGKAEPRSKQKPKPRSSPAQQLRERRQREAAEADAALAAATEEPTQTETDNGDEAE